MNYKTKIFLVVDKKSNQVKYPFLSRLKAETWKSKYRNEHRRYVIKYKIVRVNFDIEY